MGGNGKIPSRSGCGGGDRCEVYWKCWVAVDGMYIFLENLVEWAIVMVMIITRFVYVKIISYTFFTGITELQWVVWNNWLGEIEVMIVVMMFACGHLLGSETSLFLRRKNPLQYRTCVWLE